MSDEAARAPTFDGTLRAIVAADRLALSEASAEKEPAWLRDAPERGM